MSLSSSLLWRGLLAIAVGIVSVIWPNITVSAFVILFAVYAFIAAGTDVMRAFSSKRAGPVAGYLLWPSCPWPPASVPWSGRASPRWCSLSGSARGP
jgi:hypothetical protein